MKLAQLGEFAFEVANGAVPVILRNNQIASKILKANALLTILLTIIKIIIHCKQSNTKTRFILRKHALFHFRKKVYVLRLFGGMIQDIIGSFSEIKNKIYTAIEIKISAKNAKTKFPGLHCFSFLARATSAYSVVLKTLKTVSFHNEQNSVQYILPTIS